jgi:hypothetical protein
MKSALSTEPPTIEDMLTSPVEAIDVPLDVHLDPGLYHPVWLVSAIGSILRGCGGKACPAVYSATLAGMEHAQGKGRPC